MKNTIRVIAMLLLAVFAGTFIVATASKKLRQKNLAKKHQEPSTEAAPTEDVTLSRPEKPLFYTSVGGSTQGAKGETPANKMTSRYTIEIAIFKSQAEADDLLLKLKSRGIDGFYTPTRRGGEVFYRVRLGMFTSQDDAEKARLKISQASSYKGSVAKLQ